MNRPAPPRTRRRAPRCPRGALLLLAAALAGSTGSAQISYLGAGYLQNFDALQGTANNMVDVPWVDNVTLPGWYASRAAYTVTNGTLGGSATSFDDTATPGNAGLFSFGAASATERALGARAPGGGPIRFGTRLVNRTGQTLTRFAIAYVGEQWFKSSATAAQTLTVDYQLGATSLASGIWTAIAPLTFTSPIISPAPPASLNGNAAANRSLRVASVTGISWLPNQELWVRFTDEDDDGVEHGLGIDDFVFWSGEDTGLHFNGTSSYVTMGAAPALGLRTFTLEAWIMRTGPGVTSSSGSGGVTGVPLITKGRGEADGSNVDCNYFFGINSAGRLVADFEAAPAPEITAGQNFPVVGTTSLALGQWYHVAATYNGAVWRLYVNGNLDASETPPAGAIPRFDSIQHFGLGTALNSTGVAEGYFHGLIDEVRIWNVARTPEEIRATRDLPMAAALPGLVARYALDEGAGTTVGGQLGTAPAGTLRNSPAWLPGRRLVANELPSVALTSPTFDYAGMFPATVPLAATATDRDGTIVKVEFLADGVKVGEATEPPFTLEWRRAAAGSHLLTAVAIDNSGDRTTSEPVAITVAPNPNRPPTVALEAPAVAASLNGTSTTLRVTLSDFEGDALRVTFFGRKTVPPTPGPDFVVGTLPDTQYYSENLNNRSALFFAQTQWYVDNRDSLNLAFVSHLGDIVDKGDLHPDTGLSNLPEWLVADQAMRILEDRVLTFRPYGIPWGVAPGNHDQTPNGSSTGTTNFFNQFFGISRFADRPYYAGHYRNNNNNNYQLFSASGLDFIILHLEYDARAPSFYEPILDWADAVLAAHPHRRAIVTTHWMVNTGNPATFSTQGRAIYDRLKHHPGLFLLLGGHIHGEGRRSDVFAGRTVHSLLQDYQFRANGGDSWLRYYVFSPARNTISARTYSPSLNQRETDADSEFTLSYNMQRAAMDWVPLGTVNVPAGGSTATLDWTGLARGAHYEWYAEVQDDVGGSTVASRRFSTVSATPPAVALTAPTPNTRVNMPVALRLAASVSAPPEEIVRVEFHHGNTEIGEDTTAPYEVTWTGAISGSYSLTAIAVDRNGAYMLSTPIAVTVVNPNNQPPSVSLTTPSSQARYLAPASITLGGKFADADGIVSKVEFFAGTTKLGESTTAPFSLAWNSVAAGQYTVTARATDNDGGVTTSTPITIAVTVPVVTELIPRNAVWKYLDNGSNQGTAWRAPAFNDSAWPSGAAELGYGDGDETTLVGFGPNPASRAVTTYFRRTFDVPDPARIGQLAINLVRDDGAIVYLNGVEIGRSAMAEGVSYLYTGLAPTAVEGIDESTFFPLVFSTDPLPLLVRGSNTLAVEVHQQAIVNSDLSFNLEFLDRQFPVGQPPTITLTAPVAGATFVAPATVGVVAAAADPDGSVARVEFFQNGVKFAEATSAPYSAVVSGVAAGTLTLNAVVTDIAGNFIKSAPIAVTVREVDPGRFVNFSLRSNVSPGNGTLIVGFATGGAGTQGPKPLLLRAIGPGLAPFGLTNFLADPVANLYSGNTLIASNDNWAGDEQVRAVGAQVGAFPLHDVASLDAALVATPPAGAYSLQVAGPSGVALVEIYDATPADRHTPSTPRLINLSVRALVGGGNDAMIAGVVLGGSTERTVLFRAVGPALSSFGVTNALADPRLEVYQAGRETPLATNLDWGGTATLATAFARVGAFALGATSRDAALLLRLAPGVYTARLSGPTGATGIALIEIYEVR